MFNEAFSEFSFGFAITTEWIDRLGSGLVVPPEFPSLLREGQTGGGWDVFLKTPTLCMYLQFKLSEYMIKATAGSMPVITVLTIASGFETELATQGEHNTKC
jgi:hypothetical protein